MLPKIASGSTDPVSENNFLSIRQVLGGGVSLDNFNIQVIEGTTSEETDTQKLFIHSMSQQPIMFVPICGDVYVQAYDKKYVDIRSTKPGVNFVGLLFAGKSVANENVPNIGDTSYLTTEEIIQQQINATSSLGGSTYSVNPTVGPYVGSSFVKVLADNDYLYFLCADAINGAILGRVSRATNQYTKLALTATQLDTMFDDGTFLWVIEDGSAGSVKVFKIDKSTFSLSSTITCSVSLQSLSAIDKISDLYVDGSNIYFLGRWSATLGTRLQKHNKTTGAEVGTILLAGFNSYKMAITGSFIYLFDNNNAAGTDIRFHKLYQGAISGTISAPTINIWERTTITQPLNRVVGMSVLVEGTIWTVAVVTDSSTGAVANNYYTHAFIGYNLSTGGISIYPIHITHLENSFGTMKHHLVHSGRFLFTINYNSSAPINIIAMSVDDYSISAIYLPIFSTANLELGTNTFSTNTSILDDPDGNLIYIKNDSNNARSNLEYFTIDKGLF